MNQYTYFVLGILLGIVDSKCILWYHIFGGMDYE